MASHFTLIPAYGRDYNSKREAVEAFNADFDWEDASFDASGRYVNRPQIPEGAAVHLRYKRMTQVAVIRCGDPTPTVKAKGPRKARPSHYQISFTYRNDYKGDTEGDTQEIDPWALQVAGTTFTVGAKFGRKEEAKQSARSQLKLCTRKLWKARVFAFYKGQEYSELVAAYVSDGYRVRVDKTLNAS